MNIQVGTEPVERQRAAHLLFLMALLVLPGAWGFYGWASLFVPLTAFVFVAKYGHGYTNRLFVLAIVAATIISFFLQTLELTLFSIAMIPAGYIIAHSAQNNEQPWLAGFKGALALGVSLFIFFGILLIDSESSFFSLLTESVDRATEEAINQYRQGSDISSENYQMLEQTLQQMRYVAPMVMPAILASLVCVATWTTLVLGNLLLPKLGCSQPWPEYKYWSLPDKLIWVVILAGLLLILPGVALRTIGINGVIVLCLIYSFQGFAILVFFLNKWKVPRMWRVVIYFLTILQSFGTILLLCLGIADVWFNLRRPRAEGEGDKNTLE